MQQCISSPTVLTGIDCLIIWTAAVVYSSLQVSNTAMPKKADVPRLCKIDPDVFIAIDDLVHEDRHKNVGGVLWLTLVRLELVAALLHGDAVDAKGHIDKELLKEYKGDLRDILCKSDEAADALQYMCYKFLQPLKMVSPRLTPHTPYFFLPEGTSTWNDGLATEGNYVCTHWHLHPAASLALLK